MLNRRKFINTAASTTLLLATQSCIEKKNNSSIEKPNILWLTVEDSSYYEFGCYGNSSVKTPNIDNLAERGIQFLNAWSTAPQCSPARASIISGCYATSYGTDYHRQKYSVPPKLYFFTQFLQQAGYFCTNNYKTDYNSKSSECKVWDECSNQASYNSSHRQRDRPFFSVFNFTATHMSRVRSFHLDERQDFTQQGLNPSDLELPPHLPDLPEVRSDYAFHLSGIQEVDRWVGLFLEDLTKQKLEDNTIIFFFSDHGGVLPRGKGFVYETGLRVPLIVYFPPLWQHLSNIKPGTKSKQLVNFVDLAPTILSLANVKPVDSMQGKAFLGNYQSSPSKIQFGFRTNQQHHYDPSRAATDGQFKYIRNYIPYKPLGLRNFYQWGVPSYQAWDRYILEKQYQETIWQQPYLTKPEEMLFDLNQDPFELNNLAPNEAYGDILAKLRAAISQHIREIKDLGFIIISVREKSKPLYTWIRENQYPHDELITAAEIASEDNSQNVVKLLEYLKSDRAEFRFWGASGLAYLGSRQIIDDCPPLLLDTMQDANSEVATTAAEAVCYLGHGDLGLPVLITKFQQKMISAYSSLETISLNQTYSQQIYPYLDQLEEFAQQPSDGTLSDRGLAARSILVNLGKLPMAQLYPTELTEKKGKKINQKNHPLKPRPI